jgi:hypothetical protein
MLQIPIDNGLAKASSISNVRHGGPLIIGNWIERANLLTTRIVHDELE